MRYWGGGEIGLKNFALLRNFCPWAWIPDVSWTVFNHLLEKSFHSSCYALWSVGLNQDFNPDFFSGCKDDYIVLDVHTTFLLSNTKDFPIPHLCYYLWAITAVHFFPCHKGRNAEKIIKGFVCHHSDSLDLSLVQSLGREDPLEKELAIHSSILAWRIIWTEKPGRLQFIGSQRIGHDWATTFHFFFFYWISYPSFC